MLPSVMRADYQKNIYLTDELSEELQDQLFLWFRGNFVGPSARTWAFASTNGVA